MCQRLKKTGCYLLIIVLLPYIVTIFLSGPPDLTTAGLDENMVQAQTEDGEVSISMRDYAIGILAKEISAEYNEEALKAQAVLIRTKIYKKMQDEGSSAIQEDFWTKEEMEEAWGAASYMLYLRKLEKAWDETEGQVLMFEDNLAHTPYFRLSNGSTRDGKEVLGEGYPYLKIVECPLDIEVVEQMQTTTLEDMDAEVLTCDSSGYVLVVRVGQENVSGEEFRSNYHLASSCFTLQKYDGKLRITTRGVGHGLGMSQNTANELAKDGKTSREILQYFFEGTEIREVADIIST